jgi:hypothetical protein
MSSWIWSRVSLKSTYMIGNDGCKLAEKKERWLHGSKIHQSLKEVVRRAMWPESARLMNAGQCKKVSTQLEMGVLSEEFVSASKSSVRKVAARLWIVARTGHWHSEYQKHDSQGLPAIEKFSIQNHRVKWHFCGVSQPCMTARRSAFETQIPQN